MSKVLSLRVPDDLAAWAEGYAESRGVPRQELLVSALVSFREDCEAGVPDIRARVQAMRERDADRNGECVCPVFEDGRRGFRQRCPVHGGKSREDFAAATAERAALFARLKAPASSHGMKKAPK